MLITQIVVLLVSDSSTKHIKCSLFKGVSIETENRRLFLQKAPS